MTPAGDTIFDRADSELLEEQIQREQQQQWQHNTHIPMKFIIVSAQIAIWT